MTEGKIQGKRFYVRNNEEFEITEFELAGSNCTIIVAVPLDLLPTGK